MERSARSVRFKKNKDMNSSLKFSAISARASESPIGEMMHRALSDPKMISLAAGFVDNETLPIELTARAAAELLGDRPAATRALQYGTNQGNEGLREHLIDRLERSEGAAKGSFAELSGRIVLTQGSQQMLYLLAEVLLDPGDIVLVEAPTYFVFLDVVKARGARSIGIACDEGGMRLDALEAVLGEIDARGELGRVKLIYTVSEHNNPTGLSLADDRRGPLVEIAKRWSRRSRILILEDSAYRGLTFSGTEPASVWSHDSDRDRVILARTFSKTLSPGLRCGYAVLPEDLVAPVLALKGSHDFGSAHFIQGLLEVILRDGSYERHVEELRRSYRAKRDVMIQALEEHFGTGSGVRWTNPAGGIYVWLTFPAEVDTGRGGLLMERSLAEGVMYVPGDLAYPREPIDPPRNHARLTFGVPRDFELVEGTRRLAAAFAECFAVPV
jgi:2-aminoadipate transaminase